MDACDNPKRETSSLLVDFFYHSPHCNVDGRSVARLVGWSLLRDQPCLMGSKYLPIKLSLKRVKEEDIARFSPFESTSVGYLLSSR